MSVEKTSEIRNQQAADAAAPFPQEVLTLDAGRSWFLSAEQLARLGLEGAPHLDASPQTPVGTPKDTSGKPPATPVGTPKQTTGKPPATPVGTPKSAQGSMSMHASPKSAQGTPPRRV